jgi:hypothetical protein
MAEFPEKFDDGSKIPVAEQLLFLAKSNYEVVRSTENEFFAIPLRGPKIAKSLNGNHNSFSNDLLMRYRNAKPGKIASPVAVQDAIRILRATAAETDAVKMHIRYAMHKNSVYVDLGDSSGAAVEITKNGWHVIDSPPILFKRTQLTSALPPPKSGGCIDDIFDLVNIPHAMRELFIGFLIASCFETIAHPILVINGEQGSGKSKATNFIVGLIDPSAAPLRKPPRDIQSWVESANGSYVIAIDNISKIRDWESDAYCRASTGDGDVKRQHYSDSDLVVYSFRRVLIVNGINLSELRDDLNDRLIALRLPVVSLENRKLESELDEIWSAKQPELTGAIYTLCSQVLASIDSVSLDRYPRMADFANVLAALDIVRGGGALNAYFAEIERSAHNAIEENTFLSEMTKSLTSYWIGSASELNELLEAGGANVYRKDWPQSSAEITERLTRTAPTLRKTGWTIENTGTKNREKVTRWKIVPPGGGTGSNS